MKELKLLGKYIITAKIKVITGLHIGVPTTGLNIGGVDNIVIKDAEGKPYIPGSSIKGKIRSLLEKCEGLAGDDKRIYVVEKKISIHMCDDRECPLCNIFGRTTREEPYHTPSGGEMTIHKENVSPTRLIVRDAKLNPQSIPEEVREKLDLEWTEVKWENVIDRVTSAANPRQMERVPPGADFGSKDEPFEMIYNVFDDSDKRNLKYVFKGMQLLEDDYIGGSGSRGYGKIKFEDIGLFWNSDKDYENGTIELNAERKINKKYPTLAEILAHFDELIG